MVDPTGAIGLIYTFFKDAWAHIQKKKESHEKEVADKQEQHKKETEYKHESKLVTLNDSECLRIAHLWEQEGYTVRWTLQRHLAERQREGFIILQEKDDNARIIYDVRVYNRDRGAEDNMIPVGKKTPPESNHQT